MQFDYKIILKQNIFFPNYINFILQNMHTNKSTSPFDDRKNLKIIYIRHY